jgi:hypothetical protein
MKSYKHLLRSAALAAVLLGGSAAAQAGWIQIVDPDATDAATNPGSGAGGPSNQSAATIGLWLQDLLNAASAPAVLAQADDFSAATIAGLPSAGTLYLTLHYGNFAGANNVTVAYSCSTGCGPTFTGYQTQGLSNYRLFGTVTNVPEPMTLGLLGLGLAAAGLRRRRK